ncbi:hypothetical protein BHE74_00039521 [Ensete ventricosum]|nr:hypothetical protein BHE74_00039521 [Ensete ventricosum]RZR77369.1 hypothetical protein BHM03_00002412 [Ensete ventricosum]
MRYGRASLSILSHTREERLRPAAAVRRLPAAGEAATAEEEGCHLFIISTYGRTRLRLFSALTSAVCVFETSTSSSESETPKEKEQWRGRRATCKGAGGVRQAPCAFSPQEKVAVAVAAPGAVSPPSVRWSA